MISLKEITKLAELARIKLTEKEKQKLQTDLKAILEYFKKLQALDVISNGTENFSDFNFNEFREDENANKEGEYSEILLSQAPEKENGYLKVKKIL